MERNTREMEGEKDKELKLNKKNVKHNRNISSLITDRQQTVNSKSLHYLST